MSESHADEVDGDQPKKDDAGDLVQGLARGLSLIEAFTEHGPRLTASSAARATNTTRAAARRSLMTLTQLGYAGRDGDDYYLRPRVLSLAAAYLASVDVLPIIQPELDKLAAVFRESCSASVLDEGEIVYIARADAGRIMQVRLSVGSRLPAYAASMGRVLLAELSEAELARYFQIWHPEHLTSRTVVGEAELRAILLETRKKGWAMVDGEFEEGVRSIAVPVRGASGQVICAMNVSASPSRVSIPELRGRFLTSLLEAADVAGRYLLRMPLR